jgi:hypothetical protein
MILASHAGEVNGKKNEFIVKIQANIANHPTWSRCSVLCFCARAYCRGNQIIHQKSMRAFICPYCNEVGKLKEGLATQILSLEFAIAVPAASTFAALVPSMEKKCISWLREFEVGWDCFLGANLRLVCSFYFECVCKYFFCYFLHVAASLFFFSKNCSVPNKISNK